MKRAFSIIAALATASTTAGCGAGVGDILDGLFNTSDLTMGGGGDMAMGGGGDMAMVTLFRLPEGVYKISGPVTMLTDGCMVDPNNAMNPTAGQIWALKNDGTGNIKLGNPDKPAMPAMPQQYDVAESGTPPQPALGASCPGMNNPAQCASEPNAKPFNNNMGTLVRDNGVTAMNCMFHRHIVNELTLTADGKFTSSYTRKDTMKTMCMTNKEDCTTTWSWNFEFVKKFGE